MHSNKVLIGMQMEFKSLRLYKWQVLSSLLILPFSYVFVVLLAGNVHGGNIAYILTGYMVATLIGAFLGLYAMRICNLMQPEVLELYATFQVSVTQTVLSYCFSYMLLSLPIIIMSLAISIHYAASVNVVLLIAGTLISIAAITLLAMCLGLVIKNMYKAQGIIPMLSWVFLLIAPIYYSTQNLNPVYKAVLLINPVTHCLNLVRVALGFQPVVGILWSFGYLLIFIVVLAVYALGAFRRTYILERLY